LKVAKDVKDTGSEAMLYGNQVHKAAENFIKEGTPIPKKFEYLNPIVNSLNAIEGDKHCELRFGISYDGEKHKETKFFAKDVWFRGIADLVIVDGEKAYLVDYKTGKNAKYADTKQLDMLAAATFTYFPNVEIIKSALAYVVSNEFIKKNHTRDEQELLYSTFDEPLEALAAAEEHDVWNAISSPLCGWCPVTSCEHHRKR
jgi:RecB family exonuclease